jgi:hypothetical protein
LAGVKRQAQVQPIPHFAEATPLSFAVTNTIIGNHTGCFQDSGPHLNGLGLKNAGHYDCM